MKYYTVIKKDTFKEILMTEKYLVFLFKKK